jgi:hypothetical protein
MNVYAKPAAMIVEALSPKPRLLPSFRELAGEATCREVALALWERADRLEKAGNFEGAINANHAAVMLGLERSEGV